MQLVNEVQLYSATTARFGAVLRTVRLGSYMIAVGVESPVGFAISTILVTCWPRGCRASHSHEVVDLSDPFV